MMSSIINFLDNEHKQKQQRQRQRQHDGDNMTNNSAKGRNITTILYERSIRGCNGTVGGVRRRSNTTMTTTTTTNIDRIILNSNNINVTANAEQTPPSSSNDTTEEEKMDITETAITESNAPSITTPTNGNNQQQQQHYNENLSELIDLQEEKQEILSHTNNTSGTCTHLNSYPCKISNEIQNYSEKYSITNYKSSYINLKPDTIEPLTSSSNSSSNAVVSTISIVFSTDGCILASTHGDHSVKITCCHSGKLLRSLEGHPRTPWTVKFHPTNSLIVASGCLGYQVRVWNWNYLPQHASNTNNVNDNDSSINKENIYNNANSNRIGICLHMIRLQNAIISLAFHPTSSLIAAASGTNLVLWDYNEYCTELDNTKNSNDTNTNQQQKQKPPKQKLFPVVEIRHESALRCVHFPPNGNTIIVGGVDPTEGGLPATTIFSLRLYDFDINQALRKRSTRINNNSTSSIANSNNINSTNDNDNNNTTDQYSQSVLTNCRTLVSRALLYNDGGFDVSPCGTKLCACAEYWLPNNVKCATDLFPKDDYIIHDSDDHDHDLHMDNNASTDDGSNSNDNVIVSNSNIQPSTDSSSTTTSGSLLAVPNTSSDASNATTVQSTSTPDNNNNATSTTTTPFRRRPRVSRYPVTPPISYRQYVPLSPPPPPGRRLPGGLDTLNNRNNDTNNASFQMRRQQNQQQYRQTISGNTTNTFSSHGQQHSSISPAAGSTVEGKIVPHVVTVNLTPSKLGQLLEAAPLDKRKASGVTCVKFSPSSEYCLLGYGVRETSSSENNSNQPLPHTVTAVYRIKGGMTHVSTMMSLDDDVNIARFHPHSGHGFVYGTKQGRLRIMSPKPWNYFCSSVDDA